VRLHPGPDVVLLHRLRPDGAVSATLFPHDPGLPTLARALDSDVVVGKMTPTFLTGSVDVEEITPEKLWLRRDGSCNLRYRLRLSDSPDDATVVLGRVHHGAVALYRFPVDPDLPTLASAVHPGTLSRLEPFAGRVSQPTVTVVHHPREGPCVLRYLDCSPADGGAGGSTLFGKVYGDGRGDIVDGFLRALCRVQDAHGLHAHARFPKPVLYSSRLRLLLTESLPGDPSVPRLLKAALRPGSPAGPAEEQMLRSAVHDSGRALAALHGSDLSTAPVHSATEEVVALQADLHLDEKVWPDLAAPLRHRVDTLAAEVPVAPDMVLSHGDFTPSQVLLNDRGPAVVDLDTLCWADPALDLGRYLAHLELLATKVGGPAARGLTETLTVEFLSGYGDLTPRTARSAGAVDRIAFYKAAALARTALHSCRQLKQHRLELAESLLAGVLAGRVEL
jgi:aminoglycoside phosphotransferase